MANKQLIIVESPSKIKTLNKYLGDEFQIEASVGHIRDLIKSNLGLCRVQNSGGITISPAAMPSDARI